MVEIFKLDNGSKLIWVSVPFSRTIDTFVRVNCGRDHEPDQLAGISHFLEHMAFRHEHHDTNIYQYLNDVGITFSAETNYNYTKYSLSGRIGNALNMLNVLGTIIKARDFNEFEVEIERSVITQEMLEVHGNFNHTKQHLIRQAAMNTDVTQYVIGDHSTVNNISADDLVHFKNLNYTAQNTTLFIVGDSNSANYDMIKNSALSLLSSLSKGNSTNCCNSVQHYLDPNMIYNFGSEEDEGNPTDVILEWAVPDVADSIRLQVLSEMLNSHLFQEVRYMSGSCYSITAGLSSMFGKDKKIQVELRCEPQHVQQVLNQVITSASNLMSGITSDNVNKIQQKHLLRIDRMLDDPRMFVDLVHDLDIESLNINDLFKFYDDVQLPINVADLITEYKQIFTNPYSVVIIGDSNL